jgi:hypothetical protein
MATSANADTAVSGGAVLGVVYLRGRVHSKRRVQTQAGPLHLTILKLPAKDQYSAPSTVEVRSKESLGDVGDDVSVKCAIGGYGKSYEVKDAETGEIKRVSTADNQLTQVA